MGGLDEPIPQGLKALFTALVGTAEAVPFPKAFLELELAHSCRYRKTMLARSITTG